jgi:hypothetical protein
MKSMLMKPLVGVLLDTRIEETLPSGSEVEVSDSSPRGWVEISCNGSQYSVFPDDLLDACSLDDVGNITGLD